MQELRVFEVQLISLSSTAAGPQRRNAVAPFSISPHSICAFGATEKAKAVYAASDNLFFNTSHRERGLFTPLIFLA